MKKILVAIIFIFVFVSFVDFAFADPKAEENARKVQQFAQTRNICQNLYQFAIKKDNFPDAIKYLEKDNDYIDKILTIEKKGPTADTLITQKIGNDVTIARLYYKAANKDKAIELLNKLLKNPKLSKDLELNIYVDLSTIYKEKEQFEEAEKVLLKALKLSEESK